MKIVKSNLKHLIAVNVLFFILILISLLLDSDMLGLVSLGFVIIITTIIYASKLIDMMNLWNVYIYRYFKYPLFYFRGNIDLDKPLEYYVKICDYSITGHEHLNRLFGFQIGEDIFSIAYSDKTKELYVDCLVNGEVLVREFNIENNLEYHPVFKLKIEKINDYISLSVDNTYIYDNNEIKIYFNSTERDAILLGPLYKGNSNHKTIKFELIKM